MDKKVLYGLLDSIVEEVAKNEGLEEQEARTFVGVALRRNREAFISTVVVPTLVVQGQPKPTKPSFEPFFVGETNEQLAS